LSIALKDTRRGGNSVPLKKVMVTATAPRKVGRVLAGREIPLPTSSPGDQDNLQDEAGCPGPNGRFIVFNRSPIRPNRAPKKKISISKRPPTPAAGRSNPGHVAEHVIV